ncbi:MAG: ABC transporter ATP-binding protein [Clostridiaceae bacterium]
MSDITLKVSNLTKEYGSFKAVDDLSFEVKKGEIFGFLGPNGAGKTTTINMICGLIPFNRGDIYLNGVSVSKDKYSTRSLIGMCPQNILIWKDLTCIEQIEFMGGMYDVPKKAARERGLELLESMKLIEKKDKLGKTLSGGMQRRLNIILALIHDPEIVILDEPEAGLDPQSKVLVRDYIKSLAEVKTVILTTHDMDEAERLCHRIAIIDGGKIVAKGTSKELKSQSGDSEILQITISNGDKNKILAEKLRGIVKEIKINENIINITGDEILEKISDIVGNIKSSNVSVEDIKIRKKTLEDVFIQLIGRGLRE